MMVGVRPGLGRAYVGPVPVRESVTLMHENKTNGAGRHEHHRDRGIEIEETAVDVAVEGVPR
jgi:hypothetical protein